MAHKKAADFRPHYVPVRRRLRDGLVQDDLVLSGVWVEAPLDDEWTAAYRLVPQAGVPVIGEIRIFPQQARRSEGAPGLWDGALLGRAVEVPDGGLSARVLRRVTVGEHLRFGNESLALYQHVPGWSEMLKPFARVDPRRKPKGPGGRPRRPDLFYAQLAATYVDAVNSGHRKPVERAAAAAKQPPGRVRTMLHQARRRGLLAGSKPGRALGALTPRARVLLKQAQRKRGRKRGRR